MSAKPTTHGPDRLRSCLNFFVGNEEKDFLRAEATKRGMTLTMYLRDLIRAEMRRAKPTKSEDREFCEGVKKWQVEVDARIAKKMEREE